MNTSLILLAHGDALVTLNLSPGSTLAGAGVRLVQTVIENGPYLLCGVVLAGLLRGVVGAEAIQRRLGRHSRAGLIRASAFGFLLPLGALGALPVARRLHAMKVPHGTVLAFLLAAAVVDPLSIVLGMSLMSVQTMAACVAALLAWSIVAGHLVNRLEPGTRVPGEEDIERLPDTATARLGRVVSDIAAELSGPSLHDLALAATGAGLLGAFLPPGWLEMAASPSRPSAGLITAAIGTLACVTPLGAMRQAGVLVRDGGTNQVAFLLLAFGAGFNLAVLAWLQRGLKLKPGTLAAVMAVGLGIHGLAGWGLDRTKNALPRGASFHTHAFDELGRANFGDPGLFQAASTAWAIGAKNGETYLPALAPLGLLAVAGLIARQPRVRRGLIRWSEAWETPPRSNSGTRVWERSLSPRLTAALGLTAAIPGVVALVLAFYPAPAVLFEEMVPVHTEVQYTVRHGDARESLVWLERWEALIQKLGPSLILRRGVLTVTARARKDDLLDAIAALRGFLEEGRIEEARTLLDHVGKAQQACRQTFDQGI